MNAPAPPSYNLLDEAWIPATGLDGRERQLGIVELFHQAHELRAIGGELPTTTFSLIRLLLAILHRSFSFEDEASGASTEELGVATWQELWTARGRALPIELISEYVESHRSRFDLLHPETPFFQVASLNTAKGEVSGLEKLIADVPNGDQFFTTRAGEALEWIGFAEAARWLVHANAFDISGIKSGALGDDRVKDGKGYPIGTGWAGYLGGILVEGNTVSETLLLNLVLAVDSDLFDVHREDRPVWERPPLSSAVELDEDGLPRMSPAGPADLFTWPSRRMRLSHDGSRVTGIVLSNGDPLAPQNMWVEQMTVWRRSEAQEKKLGRRVYMPRTHDPARSLWRSLQALLPKGVREDQRSSGSAYLTSMNLEWVRMLQKSWPPDNMVPLDPDMPIHTRAIGISYGPQSSTIAEIVDDSLGVHAVLFGDSGWELAQRAVRAVSDTEVAVQALASLAGNLAVAAGGESSGVRDRAREQAYYALDSEFRRWLADLKGPNEPRAAEPLAALLDWYQTARGLLSAVADDLIAAAGPAALVGRVDNNRHIDTALADIWFRRALAKALPDSASFDDSETPDEDGQGEQER